MYPVLLDQFKQFTDLVTLGVLAIGLNGKWSRDFRMHILAMAALGPIPRKSERSQYTLEVAETDIALAVQ